MDVKMTPSEFYRALSKRTNSKPERIQEVWEIFGAFVVEELLRHGECYLPYLGNISLVQMGDRYGHVPDVNNEGEIKKIYIEPYFQIKFNSTETLKQNINNGRKPRYAIKRERERYRAEKEKEIEIERTRELIRKQDEAIKLARKKRLDRIAKNKEKTRMSKKKQEELKRQEEFEYQYGNIEE